MSRQSGPAPSSVSRSSPCPSPPAVPQRRSGGGGPLLANPTWTSAENLLGFDIKHSFRFRKATLGWTIPIPPDPRGRLPFAEPGAAQAAAAPTGVGR
jgi:hypothetical protein